MNTTSILPLPYQYGLTQFEKQARRLASAGRQGEEELTQHIQEHFPVFMHLWAECWLPSTPFSSADARFVVARSYGFESWAKLAEFTARINQPYSEVLQFEAAINAIVTGDVATLGALLRGNRELVHLRSMRVHHATLLHYVAANGIESYRQHSPENVITVAKILLDAGADPNAPFPGSSGSATAVELVATSLHIQCPNIQATLMQMLHEAGTRYTA
jgi:hypothetical protein